MADLLKPGWSKPSTIVFASEIPANEKAFAFALAQAAEFGHGVEDEIRILMLHGLLHLLGMDHESDNGAMARRESLWRRKLHLPTSLIARVSA